MSLERVDANAAGTGFSPTPGRKNLVFLRAGRSSLHTSWAVDDARTFDLVVDAWTGDAAAYEGTCDHLFTSTAKNLQHGIHAFFTAHPEALDHYDAVWVTCDDIDTDPATIEGLFALHEQLGYALAQPALTPDSHFVHSIVIQHRGLSVRQVDFVEFMVPIFTTGALRECLELFGESQFGWGLDSIWPALMRRGGHRLAVYDCLPVRHTRPTGSTGGQGGTVQEAHTEAVNIVSRYGLPPGILSKAVSRAWDSAFEELPRQDLYCALEAAFPDPSTLTSPVLEWDVYAAALRETRHHIDQDVLTTADSWRKPLAPVHLSFLVFAAAGTGEEEVAATLRSISESTAEAPALTSDVVLMSTTGALPAGVDHGLPASVLTAVATRATQPWQAFSEPRDLPPGTVVVTLCAGETVTSSVVAALAGR